MDANPVENLTEEKHNATLQTSNQTSINDNFTDMGSSMEVDDLNSSITSTASVSSEGTASILTSSTKKVKLTKEEYSILKDEREKMKAEREILKVERERARLEKEKARVEKEKQKMERETKLLQEREKKAQELQEKKLLLEKEKQEKLRAKEEEKEKKEIERIRNKEIKEKERQRRLDEKIALDQEKTKQEEKKLEKSRAVLFNFLKKSKENSENINDKSASDFGEDYVIKSKIVLNVGDFDANKFIEEINQENPLEDLYLHKLLSGQIKPKSRTELKSDDDCDVMIIDNEPEFSNEKFCFLQFSENIRPAYFGTRTFSSSAIITGRNPFARDESLNYDVDSDEEWDEGGPGESLSDSEPETEDKDDYEIDNDFFVPHGYLSEDENETNEPISEDIDNQGCTGPLYKEQTLLAERNRRFSHSLVPQVIGCVWDENKDNFGDKFKFLQRFQRVVLSKS